MAHELRLASLVVYSEHSALIKVRAFVDAFCRQGEIDSKTISSITLAVHEAVANIIRHAHQSQAHLPIRIHFNRYPNLVEIVMEDNGRPFDIAAVPVLDPGQLREGGRGVYLIRNLMDEVSTVSRPDGGNTLRMVKRCHTTG